MVGSDCSFVPLCRCSAGGSCSGALAGALQRLADGMADAPLHYLHDLRLRLLGLFSDFALILPNESYSRDLGALLPALAAAARALVAASGGMQRFSSLASAKDMSLDALSTLQKENLLLTKLFRQLWLHCATFNFGGLISGASGPANSAWPAEWRAALSTLATATPVLLLGSEQQKAEAFLEDATAEFAPRLTKLGAKGSPAALVQRLVQVTGGPASSAQLPAPLAAHLLTIAYKVRRFFCLHAWF